MTMTTTGRTLSISGEQKALYQDEGYMILEGVIPDDMLQMLREECALLHRLHGREDGRRATRRRCTVEPR